MTDPIRADESTASPLTGRPQILAAAVELFAERGRAGASLRALAARVGIHNSTLFHYFPDKRSLWASALDAVAERQLEWLERLEADAPPSADGFASVVDGWDRHLATSPAEARVLLEGLAGPDAEDAPSPPLLRLRALVEDWIGRAGEAGLLRAPSPEAAADRLLGMLLFRAARRGAASTKKAGEPNEGPARSFLAGLEWK